jgi:hypothetical protein
MPMGKTKGAPAAISGKTAGKRKPRPPPGKRFKPGESGNPAGRPPVNPDVREALKAACPAAVARLAAMVDSKWIDPEVQLKAAHIIIERVLGKVATPLELTGRDGAAINVEGKTRIEFDVSPERLASLAGILTRTGALTAGEGLGEDGADSDAQVDEVHPALSDGSTEGVPPS